MKTNILNQFGVICMVSTLFASCGQQKYTIDGEVPPTDNAEVIQIEAGSDTIFLSQLVKEIDIIPLESSEEAIMGSVSSIKYDDGLFFCFDYKSKKIYSFDINGSFKGLIGNSGRGHGEYTIPTAMGLDQYNKEILVLDNGKDIKKYTYDGSYVDTKELGIMAENIVATKNSLCFYTAKCVNFKSDYEDYWGSELTVYKNNKQNDVRRYIPVNKNLYPINTAHTTLTENTPFSPLSDSYTFHYNFTDNIYSIDKSTDEVKVKYVVDFGKSAYKENLADMSTMEAMQYIDEHRNNQGYVHDVFETDSLLMFSFVSNYYLYKYFKYKDSNVLKCGPYADDVFGGYFKPNGAIDNTSLFCIVDNPASLRLLNIRDVVINGKECLGSLTNSDNPIILIYHF